MSPGRRSRAPSGVFCSLQPSGGLAESDNVLYRLRPDAALLEPVATLPGHRADWDVSRLTDVWLSRSGTAMIARSLLCEGFVRASGDAQWTPLACDAITSVTQHGAHDFLLGLYDGHVAVFDSQQRAIVTQQRIAPVMGRFSHLISACGYAAGLIGTTVYGARLAGSRAGRAARWSTRLASHLTLDTVADMDVDCVSASPVLAVLGDGGLVLLDAATGALRSECMAVQGRLARWIGPGLLMVLGTHEQGGDTRTLLRVLDVERGRWTEPVELREVSRVAVRGDEVHVGFANQSIAVWDRLALVRGCGVLAFRTVPPPSGSPAIG